MVEERNPSGTWELHDTVNNTSSSLAMTTSAVRTKVEQMEALAPDVSPEVATVLSEIGEMTARSKRPARAAQRETTRLIEDLRPAPLQAQGLAAALSDYAPAIRCPVPPPRLSRGALQRPASAPRRHRGSLPHRPGSPAQRRVMPARRGSTSACAAISTASRWRSRTTASASIPACAQGLGIGGMQDRMLAIGAG